MKRMIVIAAIAALAACSQNEPAPAAEATATTTAAAAPTEVMAADGKSPVGKFRITTSEGRVIDEELKADGTYVSMLEGKVVESGRWVQKAPETFCYTNDKAGSVEVCNTESVDANGVWTTVSPDKKTATVVRVEG